VRSVKTQAKTQHRCAACGFSSSKWFGKCPDCSSWSTAAPDTGGVALVEVRTLDLAGRASLERVPTHIDEFDRAVGGGLVPGSVVLLAGEPGIGKSTLVLQVVDALVRLGHRCLLATGEESLDQVALRGKRLGLGTHSMKAMATGSLAAIEAACAAESPDVLIVDSIQTIEDESLDQGPGSPVQVRGCANRLVRFAKVTNTCVLVVGHVTKDGGVAGPKTLEHVVDAVLSLDGERTGTLRLLRATKNRFGSCEETGVFVMSEQGLEGVPDPSQLLIGDRRPGVPGSVIFPAMNGSRPMLMEIQALVVDNSKLARRVAIGIESRRLALILGVLGKRTGRDFTDKDVFVAAAGGATTNEPAADLAIALAVASSADGIALPTDAVAVGGLGLAGELRAVPSPQRRLNEAARLGLGSAFVPRSTSAASGVNVIHVDDVNDAMERALAPRDVRSTGRS
jgi:DNA repair protein RadA/Sms